MSKSRRDDRVLGGQGFDKVLVRKADGTTKEVLDISRYAGNSTARTRQDVVLEVNNQYNAKHIVGTLVNGEYVIGTLKDKSIVHRAVAVVLEPFDKPVHIKIGTADAPTKYVADFDGTQAVGTVAVTADCNHFIQFDRNDEIICTVTGADKGIAGKVAIILEVSKLGATPYSPSN